MWLCFQFVKKEDPVKAQFCLLPLKDIGNNHPIYWYPNRLWVKLIKVRLTERGFKMLQKKSNLKRKKQTGSQKSM